MRCENKSFLQNDPGFLQEITSTAVEVRLVPGGIILAHDYLHGFPGVHKAVHEFFDPLGIVPVPWPDRVGTAVITKPKS